jgi:hypothetical protein
MMRHRDGLDTLLVKVPPQVRRLGASSTMLFTGISGSSEENIAAPESRKYTLRCP